jgi:hypothetical protein
VLSKNKALTKTTLTVIPPIGSTKLEGSKISFDEDSGAGRYGITLSGEVSEKIPLTINLSATNSVGVWCNGKRTVSNRTNSISEAEELLKSWLKVSPPLK